MTFTWSNCLYILVTMFNYILINSADSECINAMNYYNNNFTAINYQLCQIIMQVRRE